MKKIAYLALVLFLGLQACKSKENKENSSSSSSSSSSSDEKSKESSDASKKGTWTASDKSAFSKACEDEIMKLKDTPDGKTIQGAGVNLEEFAKKSCDCAIEKVEKGYESPSDADKDTPGMTKIGEGCGREVMTALMKK